jgi:hypothetical protein
MRDSCSNAARTAVRIFSVSITVQLSFTVLILIAGFIPLLSFGELVEARQEQHAATSYFCNSRWRSLLISENKRCFLISPALHLFRQIVEKFRGASFAILYERARRKPCPNVEVL